MAKGLRDVLARMVVSRSPPRAGGRPSAARAAALVAALLAGPGGSPSARAEAMPAIGAAAVWEPTPEALEGARRSCSAARGAALGRCFVAAMGQHGASPDAMAFAASLPLPGFLRALRQPGRIAVGTVEYPFRANENVAWLLLGGTPSPIDVDNQRLLPRDALWKHPRFQRLARHYPMISLWPGDRGPDAGPEVEDPPKGGQGFLVTYRLRDGCHACRVVGTARYAFDFDAAGRFEGARLAGVERAEAEPVTAIGGTTVDLAAAGEQEVSLAPGQMLTLSIPANRTTGYEWELAQPLDESVLRLVGTRYQERRTDRLGAGSIEFWTFRVVGSGRTTISLKYVRPWGRQAAPATRSVTVTVE